MARSTVESSSDEDATEPRPPVPAVPTRTVPEFWFALLALYIFFFRLRIAPAPVDASLAGRHARDRRLGFGIIFPKALLACLERLFQRLA